MIEMLLQRWRGMAPRERRMVAGGAAVIALALVYLLFYEPAAVGRRQIAGELPALRAQVARMDVLVAEAARLSNAPAGTDSPEELRARIEQSAASAGLSERAQVQLVGERIEVRAKDVPFALLTGWLDTVLRETRVRVVDATVTRELQPGLVTARLALETARRDRRP